MTTVLGDALNKALETKKNDYSSFIWKGEKKRDSKEYSQDEEKIIDMTPERLKECYNHCKKMLHNDDPKEFARIVKEFLK